MNYPKDMRLRARSGKGDMPRPVSDINARNAAHERAFGKKETWWERRDRKKSKSK